MKTKTKPQLRVEIAKDVIKHIKAEEIIASGYYFSPSRSLTPYIGKQLKDVLSKIQRCEVCALGGMFYSYVKRHNNYEINSNHVSSDSMRDSIDMFSIRQLELIESAYEQNHHVSSDDYAQITIDLAINYRDKFSLGLYSQRKDALIHIMNNIIRNKGTFKP